MLVSTVTGSERVLAPETDVVVLEVVRMAVNKQFSDSYAYVVHPGSKVKDPQLYVSVGCNEGF